MQKNLQVTSIVVTHDILSAQMVADRIAWLRDGRMGFIGTMEEAARSGHPELRYFLEVGGGHGASQRV